MNFINYFIHLCVFCPAYFHGYRSPACVRTCSYCISLPGSLIDYVYGFLNDLSNSLKVIDKHTDETHQIIIFPLNIYFIDAFDNLLQTMLHISPTVMTTLISFSIAAFSFLTDLDSTLFFQLFSYPFCSILCYLNPSIYFLIPNNSLSSFYLMLSNLSSPSFFFQVRTNYLSLALHLLGGALQIIPKDPVVHNEIGVIYMRLDR